MSENYSHDKKGTVETGLVQLVRHLHKVVLPDRHAADEFRGDFFTTDGHG
jgi:hypothetical protein